MFFYCYPSRVSIRVYKQKDHSGRIVGWSAQFLGWANIWFDVRVRGLPCDETGWTLYPTKEAAIEAARAEKRKQN